MATRTDLLTPIGRLVAGSLYKGQTTDAEGRPLLVKNGPQAGQPRTDYFFAIAIPKGQEKHWAETAWGAKIWQTGHAAFPQGQAQHPQFAWKVTDGDSQIPNKRGIKPSSRPGYAGCWVLAFSSGFPPKIFNADGSQQILEPDAVKLGYYIQVFGNVSGNESMQQPGVFLNHGMVAFAAYGEEIHIGPDASAVGFGGAPLPAGASAAPIGGAFNPAPPAAPAVAAAPGIPAPTAPTSPAPSASTAPSPSSPPITPAPQFLAPPAAPVRVMLPAAQGATYEQLIGNGWTDALLVQHGMMAP